MATSIASQLAAIKSHVQADSEPLKRPFTRPSILYDPKQAADISIETIWDIANQGLELLISSDERFRNYKNDLFSHRSKELDRELMGREENNQINVSIASYLRLLSGYFLLPSASSTLEYLIRRYKVHLYNMEDLILCVLPYYDTHRFVRIVQILETRNTKWGFLDGVKVSGASLPRNVIVQQCIRDKGILEVLCSYASPSKKFHPSKHVISFCTAVFIEVLGTVVRVSNELVKRILPFVVSGLQPGIRGVSDHKAGSLMIVGLLGNKVALAPKLFNSLIRSIAEVAREEAKEMNDLQWFRLSLVALINLVQSQKVDILPKKALEILKEIRNLAGILFELSMEFDIDRFLFVLFDSLIDSCSSDEYCQQTLVSIIEKVPIKNSIHRVVTKILSTCLKLSQKVADPISSMSGGWAKKILIVINKKYPSELRRSVHHFLQDNKVRSKKDDSIYKILCKMLDGNLDSSSDLSDSKIWFALHHPKADVRRSTLADLSSSGILKSKLAVTESERLIDIKEALLRQLEDKDLTVVQAALSVEGLANVIGSSELLDVLENVLRRCLGKLISGSADSISQTCEVAVTCLRNAISYLYGDTYLRRIAAMIFPLLLVLPQTQSLNIKALGLVNEINWPLYQNLSVAPNAEMTSMPGSLSSINLKSINVMVENFMIHPEDHIAWFVESCSNLELSKTLFFLVLLQSLLIKPNSDDFSAIFESVFPILKSEWDSLVSAGDFSLEEFNSVVLDWDCTAFFNHLSQISLRTLNAKVLVCIFWRLLSVLLSTLPSDILLDDNEKWITRIKDLFVFFASSQFKHAFREHLHYLAAQCRISPPHLLSKFFTEEGVPVSVQVESLKCFAFLCSLSQDRWQIELIAELPSVLVPLASDNRDIRMAALNCIDGLCALWSYIERSGKKNGSNASWSHFVGEFLGLIDQQKTLILSDKKFLPSLFASMLSSSYHDILVLQDIENRFDQSTKEKILAFILGSALKLSNYGKLMILSLLKGVGNAMMHVKEVELLLSQLMSKHSQYYNQLDKSCQKLSTIEVQILCLLLESCVMSSSSGGNDYKGHLLKALQMDIKTPGDSACIQPCITVLNLLNSQFYMGLKNEVKDQLFCELVLLCRNAHGEIQSATREALQRIDISCSTVGHIFDLVFKQESHIIGSVYGKKKKKKLAAQQEADLPFDDICRRENSGYILSSLLDILLLKKDLQNRHLLIDPLFKLLSKIFSEEWVNGTPSHENNLVQSSSNTSATNTSTLNHIQHTLLIILEDIIKSLNSSAPLKDEITNEIDIKLLVECARISKDAVTRNHVFSLLSAVAKVFPEKVSGYILDIVAIIGESVVTQIDSHSKHVFEDLISAIVPCWLSKFDNVEDLLKIFMDLLPDIVEHKRLSIVLYLLRNLGEDKSLASLLVLLFHSLVSRRKSSFLDSQSLDALLFYTREWEYKFAVQICDQYRSMTWLPSLVKLFQQMGNDNFDQQLFLELFLAVQFSVDKLQDPEFVFKLESGEDADALQWALGELMEKVVFLLQLVDARKKQLNVPVIVRKEFNETGRALLRNITMAMIPSTYFMSIMKLLGHADKNVGRKALGLFCETARNHMIVSSKHKESEGLSANTHFPWRHMNKRSQESLNKMCLEIVRIIDYPFDNSHASLKVAAVAALEVLTNSFPSNTSVFNVCLGSVTRGIISHNSAVSSSCLRTTAALINVLGLGALAELPHIMENVMIKAKSSDAALSSSNETFLLPVLTALEAVVDKLGGFLNPFLKNIIELLVLHPEYVLGRDVKVESRAHTVRRLLAEKIPVRLALPPLLQVYLGAVEVGDNSLAIVFDMLAMLVGTMDRSSIAAFHVKIFDLCLLALDLRRQCPVAVQKIDAVEKGVINAMIALTKKLTENMFKPLFIKSIEWAESGVDKIESMPSIDRAISFYGMVNELAENHRSLFVPYFKHLLGSCVQHLSDVGNAKVSGLSRKKKKAKIQEEGNAKEAASVSIKGWHLRTLVLSSLHKCFLYDTGALKFLDSSNFQMLLKPIVSQFVIDPPASLDDNLNIPSVKEVNDLLVICIGQMAVTAGTDLLWKPLNHEVLMQTRSEKVRARILGLRIVKYLLDNLKEEYLVFLAETIPFLGELLEDVELSVKTLAQEILQEMESMSGESLRQYL